MPVHYRKLGHNLFFQPLLKFYVYRPSHFSMLYNKAQLRSRFMNQ
jgi:hypothetical protein